MHAGAMVTAAEAEAPAEAEAAGAAGLSAGAAASAACASPRKPAVTESKTGGGGGASDTGRDGGRGAWRVKVYLLSEEAEWLDIGTGYASVAFVKKVDGPAIKVVCEETSRLLLQVKVHTDDIYVHSQDNIITWNEPDPEANAELALSFQDHPGCLAVWERLAMAQRELRQRTAASATRAVPGTPANGDAAKGGAGNGAGPDAEGKTGSAAAGGVGAAAAATARAPNMGAVVSYMLAGGDCSNGLTGELGSGAGEDSVNIELPEIRSDTLVQLRDVLAGGPLPREAVKEAHAAALMENAGARLHALLDVFGDAEDLEDTETLRTLVGVFRAIAGLSDPHIIDMLLSDSFFSKVAGIFEYDPSLKPGHNHFRRFLATAQLRTVLPLRDDKVVAKIHQNFRITFFKDVLLRPMMDDKCLMVLNSLTFYNNTEIVQCLLQQDRTFLRRLFRLLDGDTSEVETGDAAMTPPPGRRDALHFTRELFDTIKMLQLPMRQSVLRQIFEDVPFFPCLAKILAPPPPATDDVTPAEADLPFGTARDRHSALDILSTTLLHDPSLFRQHTLKEAAEGVHPPPFPLGNPKEKKDFSQLAGSHAGASVVPVRGAGAPPASCSMLFWVIRSVTAEASLGCVLEATDALKITLDMPGLDSGERDAFLEVWYSEYVQWLCEPLIRFEGGGDEGPEGRAELARRYRKLGSVGAEALNAVLEICCQCLSQHNFRFKYNAIKLGVVHAVANLLRVGDPALQLTCLRFVRAAISLGDDFLNRQLIKVGGVDAMMEMLRQHRAKDNLIRSSLADVVTTLLDNSPTGTGALYDALAAHRELLESIRGLQAFSILLRRYDVAHPAAPVAEGMKALGEYTDDSGGEGAAGAEEKVGTCPDGKRRKVE